MLSGRLNLGVPRVSSLNRRVAHAAARDPAELGDIDILVNNAGVSLRRTLDELTLHDWEKTLAVNLTSVFLVTQAVLPGMRKRKFGRIINVSSVAAHTGGIVGPHSAASRAGILGLTRGYAGRVAHEGITVNAIAPALIATEMLAGFDEAVAARIPVGRFGTPEEIASTAVMLACNTYVTGQTINVDGGMYMT